MINFWASMLSRFHSINNIQLRIHISLDECIHTLHLQLWSFLPPNQRKDGRNTFSPTSTTTPAASICVMYGVRREYISFKFPLQHYKTFKWYLRSMSSTGFTLELCKAFCELPWCMNSYDDLIGFCNFRNWYI